MPESIFHLPKGLYEKYKSLFTSPEFSSQLDANDKIGELVSFTKADNISPQEFNDKIETIRIHICREENLFTDTGGSGVVSIFHK